MAWDVKATAMAVADAVPSQETLTGLQHTLVQLASNLMQSWFTLAVIATILLLVFAPTPFSQRVKSTIVESFFTNWQLALLGSAAVLLSLVSGYTTFDGMRNFTGGGMISALATFGIQGVMLVTAWLIGESFATGMSQRVPGEPNRRAADPWIGGVLGLALAGAVFYWLLKYYDASLWPGSTASQVSRFSDIALYFAMALIVVAIIFLNRKGDIALPYVQSTRVIAKNMILWVMFFACMAVSVFFSFDSHFSGIFPPEERKRAAEIRSINQVAAVVSDIGSRIQTRRIDEAQRLFDTDAWAAYEKELDAVTKIATDSPRLMREQLARELEEQKSRIAALEEKRANAQSNQAGLSTRKTALAEELSRITGERPEVATAVQQQKAVVAEVEKRLDEQRAKTMAEEKGVEGSGKVGQGQFWRAAKAEEVKVQSELQVARERLRPMETRLIAIDKRMATIKAELAQIDGDLAKLKGEADTAGQMIGVAQSAKAGDAQSVDPAAATSALERARQAFRQKPEAQGLADIQTHCATLVSTASRVASLKDAAARIECDPKQASEAAARVFALNQGLTAFVASCAGGDKLPQDGGTDGMLTFGRKCLQESGLPSRDTSEFGARLSALDLSRDDKAHRFVVTWNAFQDGNRLAYLALAIAITIDGMIFIAGLFGANAVRSPLSDVPSTKARSATQLEAIIDTALLPHKLDNARLVLGAMKPMTQRDGFMARVTIDDHDPHAPELRRVLNAGSTIGAVRHADGHDHVYEIRSELFEYLSVVAKKEFEANKDSVSLADLERTVSVALLPDIAYGAETVLSHMHPMREDRGFMAEIRLDEVKDSDQQSGRNDTRIVRSALNAGATFDRVQRVGTDAGHYYVHGDFYRTLTRIRARLMTSAAVQPRLAGPSGGSTYGGDLTERQPAIAAEHRRELPKPESAPPQRQSAPPPVRAVPAPVAPSALPQQVYNYFATQLLRGAGLDVGLFPIVHTESHIEPVAEAIRSYEFLKGAAPRLGREITDRERYIVSQIERQYDTLSQETAADSMETLAQAYGEVFKAIPALMMAQGGPLERIVDRMIQGLETAAAPDNGLRSDEHHLLQRLRLLRDGLRAIDRQSPQGWSQLAQHLDAYNEDPTRVVMPRVASVRPH